MKYFSHYLLYMIIMTAFMTNTAHAYSEYTHFQNNYAKNAYTNKNHTISLITRNNIVIFTPFNGNNSEECITFNEKFSKTLWRKHKNDKAYCFKHIYLIKDFPDPSRTSIKLKDITPILPSLYHGNKAKSILAIYPFAISEILYIAQYQNTKEGAKKCQTDLEYNKKHYSYLNNPKVICIQTAQDLLKNHSFYVHTDQKI